jgi:ATP-dependent Clp protease ATP-binding subunit ClpC
VLLLDEIEKAHPDVYNVLLQLLDDGRLTDAQGRTVDFRNTVVIMTSNLGSDVISGQLAAGFTAGGADGDDGAAASLRDRVMRRLRESFRPEFLNRIDEIIVFRRLEPEQLRRITDLLLDETRRRLRAQDLTVEFTSAAVDLLARRGHQPEFGARPLRRTIQREVDNRLSSLLLSGRLRPGQRVLVTVRDGEIALDTGSAEPAEPEDAPPRS